jgi:hypothetical protein
MKRVAVELVPVLAAALLCSGCFVWDEIEAGQAIMEAHSPNTDAKQEAAADLGGGNDSPKSARQRLAEHYAKQRAKAPAATKNRDPAAEVGRCRIGSTTQFTRRSDCRLRGGTFL